MVCTNTARDNISFELLVGEKPFQIEWGDVFDPDFDPTDTAKHWAQMMDVNLEADWSALKGVSEEGVELLRRMLNKRHDERPTAAECAEASWFHNVLEEGHAEVPAAELEARAARAWERTSHARMELDAPGWDRMAPDGTG